MGDADERRGRGWLRPLNEQELDAYWLIPEELATGARVGKIPFLPGSYQGITLGRLILLTVEIPEDGTSSLLAHELVHVRQWSTQGLIGFGVTYLRQFVTGLARTRSWRRAYLQVEAEVEARNDTAQWQRQQNLRPPTG